MRLEPSAEAMALRAAVDGVLASVTPATVRAGWPGGDRDRVRTAWRKLADTGLTSALVPAESGGLGLPDDAVLSALEAVGYSGLPVPVVETVTIAAPLLAAAGSTWLPAVLSGDAVVAMPPWHAPDGPVPYGQDSELTLLWHGPCLRVLTRDEIGGVAESSVDGARRLLLVQSAPDGPILMHDAVEAELAALRGALGSAAVLIGLSQRLLDLTVGYVQQREQFGVRIGSFQAVKHALASAVLAVRFARPAVLAAGWALSQRADDAAVQVSLAKALASEAALGVARTAIQCHGAIAYTTEYDLHLFAKRIWAIAPAWGDAGWHRAQIAAHLGLTER